LRVSISHFMPHFRLLLTLRLLPVCRPSFCFFFNDTATTEIYTLSLHDALPIWKFCRKISITRNTSTIASNRVSTTATIEETLFRSEEHTSELQSRENLVCRLLLEKKKNKDKRITCPSYTVIQKLS